ncbi:sigma-70 family RNA polymerase sigma factor [Kibdelosporangium philippinense]|uniref:Sigma-70 family RNA polymerase sigma factor n=1 Tax=Kibdelosporangium philippinense TaxID=211113 RepID=A0ABS8ZKM4_9PSEU|nr:sigma-70 family RNA polymerase sigma factor [Kibdelosporangium philippinense]MCE7008285.1 sigma-70 family RNA polymerase sigma factor [Kibdelosporangium philippinense]
MLVWSNERITTAWPGPRIYPDSSWARSHRTRRSASSPTRAALGRPASLSWEPLRPRRCRRGVITDEEAIALARAGDLDAYGALVARYTALAHRTAYLLGAGPDTSDVVQEAFVKAFKALSRFREDAQFRPWLLRIVANETKNLHRATKRRNLLELRVADDPVDHRDPAALAVRDAAKTELLNALKALPEKDRAVVTCRYLLDLSEAETAQTLGLAKGTVKSRLSRALAKLREAVSDD